MNDNKLDGLHLSETTLCLSKSLLDIDGYNLSVQIMYYPYEYLWYRDLRRWTYAEDERLIYLRTRHYDLRFNTAWRYVKLYNLDWWQDIANDAVFRRRNKDADDCYDRFCDLVDKFMEIRLMDRKERPYWEHYKMLRWFYHDCRNKFPDN